MTRFRSLTHWLCALGLAAFLFGAFAPPASAGPLTLANASGLNLGMDANFVFIDLGKTTLGWNSGPLAGSVLFGDSLTVKLSGGGNGGLSNGGFLFHDNSANISGMLQNQPVEKLVLAAETAAALEIADNVSKFAAGLTATQTFGTLTGSTTINSNASGLNVIDVNDIMNDKLTLHGSKHSLFVINVSGSFNTNQKMMLTGGLTASNVLFNFTGTSGHVLQTSGGDQLFGTFLATDGGQFQFSGLNLDGELINTDGNVQLVSNSSMKIFSPLTPPTATPEPASLLLLGSGLLGLGIVVRRQATSSSS